MIVCSAQNEKGYFRVKPYEMNNKDNIWAIYKDNNNNNNNNNKANLGDLIAATGPVILLKLDSNHRFFSPYDLEIWSMT